jgi:hypothetical protein
MFFFYKEIFEKVDFEEEEEPSLLSSTPLLSYTPLLHFLT